MNRSIRVARLVVLFVLLLLQGRIATGDHGDVRRQRFLYVASPGVRDYVEWGGHGVLVFDIDDGHRFVKRIPLAGHGINKDGKVLNVKGICASAKTGRLYVSTLQQLL